MMLRMYLRWAERRGFSVELDEVTAGGEAGILSATFTVRGDTPMGCSALSGACTGSSGCRRSIPSTGAKRASPPSSHAVHRRLRARDRDRREGSPRRYLPVVGGGWAARECHRLGGAPDASADGIVVAVQNERSQHQNKAKAMQILAAKLVERLHEERLSECPR